MWEVPLAAGRRPVPVASTRPRLTTPVPASLDRTELRAAWSRPQLDQMERLMPIAEAGQDLRALSLDGLKRARIESEQLQDRRRDLGRFHRVA